METYLTFIAKETGAFDIFCTELCGVGHSGMISKVVVMEGQDFEAWYAAVPGKTNGPKLLEEKGCLGCHSTDGTKKIGPTLKGIFGRKEVVITGGKERTIIVEDGYLRRSIIEPQADVVKDFQPIMPVTPLTKEELDMVVGYLKTLK
jgi:cytochrome c oxidase subunit 2